MAVQRKMFRIEEMARREPRRRRRADACAADADCATPQMVAEIANAAQHCWAPHKEAKAAQGRDRRHRSGHQAKPSARSRAVRTRDRRRACRASRRNSTRSSTAPNRRPSASSRRPRTSSRRPIRSPPRSRATTSRDWREDIQDHATPIFEACNFQDLTGQRISKVVTTLKLIEDHIGRMVEIWRAIETAPAIAPERVAADRTAPRSLLNGPKLPGDAAIPRRTTSTPDRSTGVLIASAPAA